MEAKVFYKKAKFGKDGVYAVILHPADAIADNQTRVETELCFDRGECECVVTEILKAHRWEKAA